MWNLLCRHRLLGCALFVLGVVACSSLATKPPAPIIGFGVVTVEAQTLPKTVTLAWDEANPPSGTTYTVTMDGVAVATNITTLSTQITFNDHLPHTLSVTAADIFGTSAPGTLTVTVVIPAPPGNLRVQ